MDDFFVRSLIAAAGVALIAAPLGCFIVWRRMAYFGDTLAHSSLLGVALALATSLPLMLSVFVVSLGVALSLVVLQRANWVSTDSLLGLLSHGSLAVGLVVFSLLDRPSAYLVEMLLGDILTVTERDIVLIFAVAAAVAAVLVLAWRPLIAMTVNQDLAAAEGQRPLLMHMLLVVLMAAVIAVSIQIVGVLLITSLLIVPAVTARRFAGRPEVMVILAAGFGLLASQAGLWGSLHWDTPSGPSIVVASFVVFLLSLLISKRGAV